MNHAKELIEKGKVEKPLQLCCWGKEAHCENFCNYRRGPSFYCDLAGREIFVEWRACKTLLNYCWAAISAFPQVRGRWWQNVNIIIASFYTPNSNPKQGVIGWSCSCYNLGGPKNDPRRRRKATAAVSTKIDEMTWNFLCITYVYIQFWGFEKIALGRLQTQL